MEINIKIDISDSSSYLKSLLAGPIYPSPDSDIYEPYIFIGKEEFYKTREREKEAYLKSKKKTENMAKSTKEHISSEIDNIIDSFKNRPYIGLIEYKVIDNFKEEVITELFKRGFIIKEDDKKVTDCKESEERSEERIEEKPSRKTTDKNSAGTLLLIICFVLIFFFFSIVTLLLKFY